jgi:hypothetical protein
MGLASIWDEKGDYLTENSKGFSARTVGCGCCSVELTTELEVKKEALDSLGYILLACRFFKWDIKDLIKIAWNKKMEKEKSYIKKKQDENDEIETMNYDAQQRDD